MADFTQGDYEYTIISSTTVNAQVVDKTKTSYEDIPSSVSDPESGREYTVVSLRDCFIGCQSLITAPIIPDSVTNMRYCFMNCTSLTSVPTIPGSVRYMNYCFSGCTSLTSAPVIPNGVTDMENCFSYCTSLTSVPTIPGSVRYMSFCFMNCTSLTSAPVIPNGVTDMENCFTNCTSLTSVPIIPDRVTNMSFCFMNCTSLTSAPVIPNGVTKMDKCFKGCSSLTGNIYVNNSNITDYRGIFTDINNTNDIYIINNTNPTDESVSTKWREIIAYTNNPKIHFEADDHTTPRATLQVTRTDSSGKSAQDGTHVHIIVNYEIFQDNIPIGWTVPRLIFERLAHDSDEEFIPVREGQDRGVYELDEEQHIIIYTIKDGYKTTTVTAILSRVMALLDFLGTGGQDGYIDIPGMGMAIGNIATRNGLDIQFPTTIGKGLLPPTKDNSDGTKSVDLDNYQLVVGKYNKLNNDAVFIIGNGSENKPSNLIEISNNGMSVMTIDNNGDSVPIAFLGYGEGQSETSMQYAPYINIGKRHKTNSIGNYSVAEGYNSTASGFTSHAEGYSTIASGHESHAEGLETTASGQASHAEGDSTIASGFRAHAEGGVTIASGSNSHAQNFGTIAAKSYQTAIGKYNLEDTEPNTSNQKAFIIGNGTDKSNRSNALTVDWNGNTEMQGRATTADMTAAEITAFINELRGN